MACMFTIDNFYPDSAILLKHDGNNNSHKLLVISTRFDYTSESSQLEAVDHPSISHTVIYMACLWVSSEVEWTIYNMSIAANTTVVVIETHVKTLASYIPSSNLQILK